MIWTDLQQAGVCSWGQERPQQLLECPQALACGQIMADMRTPGTVCCTAHSRA